MGEDEDVVLMETEDALNNLDNQAKNDDTECKYPYQYLTDCREKLMSKVRKYRAVVEDQKSQMIIMQQKQHKEIERIRTFYQGIAYAPTRSGRLVKQVHCSSQTAKEIMKELGLKYNNTKTTYSYMSFIP